MAGRATTTHDPRTTRELVGPVVLVLLYAKTLHPHPGKALAFLRPPAVKTGKQEEVLQDGDIFPQSGELWAEAHVLPPTPDPPGA